VSAFKVFSEIKFKDVECLLQALAGLGFGQVEQGHALVLYGYQGDARPERAELVIRRQHIGGLSNDVGFALRDGAYVPIVSEYDEHAWMGHDWQVVLKKAYASAAIQKLARMKGGHVVRDEQVGQNRVVKVRLYR